jgi:hypothetical protein
MTDAAARANTASTDEIRTVVERYARAWAAGDLTGVADSYHDDFTLHYFGRHDLAGDHVGKAAALATLAEFSLRTRRRLLAITAVMAGPERGAIMAREAMQAGEAVVEVDRLLVYTVLDGRLRDCWIYDADQALIDACVDGG